MSKHPVRSIVSVRIDNRTDVEWTPVYRTWCESRETPVVVNLQAQSIPPQEKNKPNHDIEVLHLTPHHRPSSSSASFIVSLSLEAVTRQRAPSPITEPPASQSPAPLRQRLGSSQTDVFEHAVQRFWTIYVLVTRGNPDKVSFGTSGSPYDTAVPEFSWHRKKAEVYVMRWRCGAVTHQVLSKLVHQSSRHIVHCRIDYFDAVAVNFEFPVMRPNGEILRKVQVVELEHGEYAKDNPQKFASKGVSQWRQPGWMCMTSSMPSPPLWEIHEPSQDWRWISDWLIEPTFLSENWIYLTAKNEMHRDPNPTTIFRMRTWTRLLQLSPALATKRNAEGKQDLMSQLKGCTTDTLRLIRLQEILSSEDDRQELLGASRVAEIVALFECDTSRLNASLELSRVMALELDELLPLFSIDRTRRKLIDVIQK